jgi:E3 ubiquitin-protein ligase RNF115/126
MQATGPQGPIPATDALIEGLPRSKLDEESIGKSYSSSSEERLCGSQKYVQGLSGL